MPTEACAMVSGILSACATVFSGYTMLTGEWECMAVTLAFAAIDFLLIGYVLAVKYCH